MKYIYILTIIGLIFLMTGTPVSAGDVTLGSARSEYTFTVGEDARIPFTVNSSFQAVNVGTLAYTLTQRENRSGVSFSQSSSQSQSFPISPGMSQNALSITSEEPTEFEVSLSIRFRDDGKDFSADLPPIRVFFVDNQSPQQQGSGQSGSGNSRTDESPLSSTTSETQQGAQGQGSDPFREMEQQMNSIRQQNQQIMQQAFSQQGMSPGSMQQPGPGSAQQALQNNQMNAQSSALQQQLYQEIDQQEQDKQALSQKIEGDQLLRKMAELLHEGGYNQTDGKLTPSGDDAGRFDATYESRNGDSIQVRGEIANGSVEKITAHSDDSLPVPKNLADDPRYQAAQTAINQSGYTDAGGSLEMSLNETRIIRKSVNQEGRNATISALIRNNSVEEVILKKDENIPVGWLIGILLFVILASVCIWAGYRYYQRRDSDIPVVAEAESKEPVNIREEALRLLTEAEAEVSAGRVKNAYILAGQALRFFLSWSSGTGSAETNEEILTLIRDSPLFRTTVEDILNRCSMVEFAKSEGNTGEFSDIVHGIRGIIQSISPDNTQEQSEG